MRATASSPLDFGDLSYNRGIEQISFDALLVAKEVNVKLFALCVFGLHTLFELVFGINNLIAGGPSSQSAEQIAAQSEQITIAFRFLGAALTGLGAIGLFVIVGPGVQSPTARYVAAGFVVFHGLGTLGSLYTAAPGFEAYAQPTAVGAVILHGFLAMGFLTLALRKSEV